MENPSGQVLVIFGASGDLAKRKLLPALFALHCEGFLPKNFAIVGVGRTEMNSDQYRQSRADDIKKFARTTAADFSKLDAFLSLVEYANFNTDNPNEYSKLADFIEKVRRLKNIPDNITFYFGIPPEMYSPTADGIKTSGLNLSNCGGFRRVVVEKPFGKSLDSARAVNLKLGSVFSENEIYRIDHYLGKETVQNILVLRFANEIFESLWNRNHIDSVEISVSESLGVENRGAYYDKSGAMRDMVQNHLLNLAAFVAMECPASFDAESIRDEVAKVLQCLRPMDEKTIDSNTMRAQYSESGNLPAYRSEKNVAADSTTETFAAMKFFIENWRWGGVPFYLYTGKRLPERKSEVIINFKSAPVQMFVGQCSGRSCNKLTMRIQPDEGVWLSFGLKIPGAGYEVAQVSMDFNYSSQACANLPDAYERLLLDAMSGDATLYARSDALEASWKFIDPILNRWKERGADGLEFYPAGSDGPEGARKMRLEHSSDSCPIRFSASAKNGNENRKM